MEIVFWFFLGMLISFFLPLVIETITKAYNSIRGTKAAANEPSWWERINGPRYLKVMLGAFFVAMVLVFFLGLEPATTREASIAGLGWESLVGKLLGQNKK
jgi:hypothetical protein